MGYDAFLVENLIDNEYETFNPLLNIGGIFCVMIGVACMYFIVLPISMIVVKSCLGEVASGAANEGGSKEDAEEESILKRLAYSFNEWLKEELFFSILIRTVQEAIIQFSISGIIFYAAPELS